MFYLIFGSFWTTITAIITIAFYSAPSVNVNGVNVSASEFSQMLWPKLFLGLFWVIGLIFLFIGIRRVVRNTATAIKGVETYGIVLDVCGTGTTVNGNREYKAEFAVIVDNSIEYISEIIGFIPYKYQMGDIYILKHHNGDINIVEKADRNKMSYDTIDRLESEVQQRFPMKRYDDYAEDDEMYGRYNRKITSDRFDEYGNEIKDYNEPDEYITINGVKYKKVDE